MNLVLNLTQQYFNPYALHRYAAINANYTDKYTSDFPSSDENKIYNIWLGDYRLTNRLKSLKNGGSSSNFTQPIAFFIEKKIDQRDSIVKTVRDKANDFVARANFRNIFDALCSEEIVMHRQIKAAGKFIACFI